MSVGSDGQPAGPRRRVRSDVPRRKQVVVRFSDEELAAVRERAALSGLAVGAWIGQIVLDVATGGAQIAVGLPDLVRLHADVVALRHADGHRSELDDEQIEHLLDRLTSAIDVVVAEQLAGRRR
ncbi:plasmid mobilization protein [Pseudonocardia sp. GCM10023141]|uniref:plasmid mobilization protein n=1 Tax=Pseudonocardia sp. GCM10023141 TaxID=3252653 RepID=UPI00360B4012